MSCFRSCSLVEVSFKNRFQFFSRLAAMPFNGSFRDIQFFRDVPDRISFDIKQVAHYSCCGVQFVQQYVDIFLFQCLDGIKTGDHIGDGLSEVFQCGPGWNSRRGSEFIQGGISYDGVYPVEELAFFFTEGVNVLKDFQHAIVDGFDCVVIVGEYPSAQTIQGDIELLVQLLLAGPIVTDASLYDPLKFFQMIFWG